MSPPVPPCRVQISRQSVCGAFCALCSAALHHINFLFVSLAGSLYTSHAVAGVRGPTPARLFVCTLWAMYASGLCAAMCLMAMSWISDAKITAFPGISRASVVGTPPKLCAALSLPRASRASWSWAVASSGTLRLAGPQRSLQRRACASQSHSSELSGGGTN